jgi:hypothetical protein
MFQFLALSGDIDYRVSTERDPVLVEWSWLGDDDGKGPAAEVGRCAKAITSSDTSTCIEETTPLSSPRPTAVPLPHSLRVP